MSRRTSFSQNNMFHKCPRAWFYSYVKKVPVISDMSYAHAGNVIHKVLEEWYANKLTTMDAAKKKFELLWKVNKLDTAKWLKDSVDFIETEKKKSEYWLMCVNGINLKVDTTSVEMKIFFKDVLGYLDVVNTKEDKIWDWKSSTRSKENEEEYTMQLMFYSYLYKRKFGRLLADAGVFYLKYTGTKGTLVVHPTEKDIEQSEKWHTDIQQRMEIVTSSNKTPEMCDHCFFFCPHKVICESKGGKLKYNIHLLGNHLQVEGPITGTLHKALDKKFSYELKSAYFIKKNNPHANTTIKFWDYNNRKLPIGFKNGLINTLNNYGKLKENTVEIGIKDYREFDNTNVEMPDKFLNGIVLRDYQNEAVDVVMKEKHALLEVGTGGGKTEISIECIRRLGVKTLFIVDKVELLKQTKERMEKALGIPIGQIGHGEDNIQDVTVATIQTLYKHLGKYSKYLNTIRFVIFDECHKVAAKSYWRLSHHFNNTEYRLGMSGTAFRDDGNDLMINAVMGFRAYDLSSKRLIREGWLMKPTISFIKGFMTDEFKQRTKTILNDMKVNPTKDYAEYYHGYISSNTERNSVIERLADKYRGKKILILVKLVDHGKELEEAIPGSRYLHGSIGKEERAEMFEQFTRGKLDVLIATIGIASEGLDIPVLDIVINAAANKGDVKTIQILGRVLRKLEGKENARYIDFVDDIDFFRQASYNRMRILKEEGHDVEVKEWEALMKSF